MKIKLTGVELIQLKRALNEVGSVKASCKFAYAVAKTQGAIASEIAALQKASRAVDHPDFAEYQKKRTAVQERYAEKDAHGKAVILKGATPLQYHILPEKIADLDKELNKLTTDKKYAKMMEHCKEVEAFNKGLLDGVIELEVHQVGLSDFPELTSNEMEILLPLVSGEQK